MSRKILALFGKKNCSRILARSSLRLLLSFQRNISALGKFGEKVFYGTRALSPNRDTAFPPSLLSPCVTTWPFQPFPYHPISHDESPPHHPPPHLHLRNPLTLSPPPPPPPPSPSSKQSSTPSSAQYPTATFRLVLASTPHHLRPSTSPPASTPPPITPSPSP